MQVEIIRSSRRRRTVSLRPTSDGKGVRISIPAHSTKQEEDHYVRTLLDQYERKRKKTDISLADRALKLSQKYDLQVPSSIEWASSQKSRWASCNVQTGSIRISSDVKSFPDWVLDYVIVHELAHLSHSGHGPEFWSFVRRYPKAERAIGFLIAKGYESSELQSEEPATSSPESNICDVTNNPSSDHEQTFS